MSPTKDTSILYTYPVKPASWNQRDVLLFALTIGCTPDEPQWVYELSSDFRPFPTYPIVLTFKHDYPGTRSFRKHFTEHLTPPEGFVRGFPALDIERVVDGERTLEIVRALPTSSEGRMFRLRSQVVGVWDKGKSRATIVKTEHILVEILSLSEDLVFARMSETAVFMGQGGWGGPNDRSPRDSSSPPTDIAPTHTHTHAIPLNAHLLYRLNGDYNPLHAAHVTAAIVQPTPIMHGLYAWNVVAHAVLTTFKRGELQSFRAKFAAPVRPGDVLQTEMWDIGEGQIKFVTRVDGRIVLGSGVAKLKSKGEMKVGVESRL